MKDKYPIILAIDTSCDDTSVAITSGAKILSNVIASQVEMHRKYGGVMPLVAKLAHHELINPTYLEALKRANINAKQIDAVAVTQGPGLAIALEVGIEFAKNLSKELNKPLIGVNHMAGHLFSAIAANSQQTPTPFLQVLENLDLKSTKDLFPALGLLVSGGHTQMLNVNLNYKYDFKINVLGQTLDDAAGEALDKFARLLGLGYPGAPVLEELAKSGDPDKYKFPLPMTNPGDLNFSFSGLKTAGRHAIEKSKTIDRQTTCDLAASFQKAVIRAIIYKLKRVIKVKSFKTLWLGGGVANNLSLRKAIRQFAKEHDLLFLYANNKRLFSDNAAMIGIAGYFQYYNENFIENFADFQRVPRLDW